MTMTIHSILVLAKIMTCSGLCAFEVPDKFEVLDKVLDKVEVLDKVFDKGEIDCAMSLLQASCLFSPSWKGT